MAYGGNYGGFDDEDEYTTNNGYGVQARGRDQGSSGRIVLDVYREDILNGFGREKPLYNAMNPSRPQSSMLLNVNDPIQVHLLVETALGDSREYEILSQEEVDELKKNIQTMTQRIEQTRQNLAIQSKYRDAAISMSKLYDKRESKQRSLLGQDRATSRADQEADQERIAIKKKCEELAMELFTLEKGIMQPQSRLLKHTAGILQMTHKGPKKGDKAQGKSQPSGIPGSPESIYTYTNARTSVEEMNEDDLFFDDRSLYQSFGNAGTDDFDSFGLGVKGGKEQLQMITKTEEKLADLNQRLREYIVKARPADASYSIPPASSKEVSAETLQGHLDYMEKGIAAMDELSGPRTSSKDQEQVETVMSGLWDFIQSGEDDARQKKFERRSQRAIQNLPPDEDESHDEDVNANEAFSVQAFSIKIQWLFTQALKLKDQKKVLQRQIKQQRELNNKSDAQKDAEMVQKQEELIRTQALLTRTENDADEVRRQLSQLMDELDHVKQSASLRTEDTSALESVQTELRARNDALAELEERLQELQDDHAISNAETSSKCSALENKVTTLTTSISEHENKAKSYAEEIQKKEAEMEEANMEIANLRTEVTIARAELDGAYGSRAQRAAEVAANPAIQKEIDDLTKRNTSLVSEIESLKQNSAGSNSQVDILKKELEETISEFEVMTKASVEWEKEREKLERIVDKLRDERESLEAQLSDEKVRWLGMKSPGAEAPGVGAGATSTSVLKNEFKKMMRETRAENAKLLRAEQTERRKLEDELRVLKKAQGPGKSSLSQSLAP